MIEQLQRTKENWTYGVINIPLLFGHNNRLGVNPRSILKKFAHNAKCYHKPFPCLDKRYRYLWFELDTTDINQHEDVLDYFAGYGLDIYCHYYDRHIFIYLVFYYRDMKSAIDAITEELPHTTIAKELLAYRLLEAIAKEAGEQRVYELLKQYFFDKYSCVPKGFLEYTHTV